jgi:hypothetical protein
MRRRGRSEPPLSGERLRRPALGTTGRAGADSESDPAAPDFGGDTPPCRRHLRNRANARTREPSNVRTREPANPRYAGTAINPSSAGETSAGLLGTTRTV